MGLIDKIRAEVEKKTKGEQGYSSGDAECGYRDCAKDILSFLDTIKVKDADLEKEISDYLTSYHLHIKDGGRVVFDNNDSPNFMCDIRHIAKYFYELGLKTQYSSIGFPNIDDTLKEEGIDPDSKEAKNIKEAYFVAIDKAFNNFKKRE